MEHKWTIARARGRLSELLREAAREPQAIFNRDKPVAVVVNAQEFENYKAWRDRQSARTLTDDFDELRRLCLAEHYDFPDIVRSDRPNPFVEALDAADR